MARAQLVSLRLPGIAGHIGADAGGAACAAGGGLSYQPDYLGGMADISALAEVCRKHGTLLAVDNAHGAICGFWNHPVTRWISRRSVL